ncbi:MAG TPA: hypothetical protein VM487_05100 [Phycisphaerae bacterium]|nr:hypothetical protein [Phycisphaerae bacterium]
MKNPNTDDPEFAPPDPDARPAVTCDRCEEDTDCVYTVHIPSVPWKSPAYTEHWCADCCRTSEDRDD